ncbi:MAG: DUF4258 domain-containing protein [Desulfobaccales bacterium]
MMILDIHQAQTQIRRIARVGNVILSDHCKNDSMPLRNVDMLDILKVFKNGNVFHELDPKTDIKYRVVGPDLENKELTVIILLIDQDSLYVKTVM